jgi:hypothetical protein
MSDTPLGLRVVGHRAGRRRLVDWRAALAAYAASDPRADLDREAYLTHFTFPDAPFRSHFEPGGSEAGYNGPCGADWLFWDIDRENAPEAALRDARGLCGAILDRYRSLDEDDLLIFVSGAKGVHVGLPCSLMGSPPASPTFHDAAKRFALVHAERAGVVVDAAVYSKVRLFRAPNSRHPRTGLHKRRLGLDELTFLTPEAIVERARQPEPFDLPEPPGTCPAALADWRAAVETSDRRAVERRAYAGRERLSRFARDFIRDGDLDAGRREVSIFRVAGELAELAHAHGVEGLVHALLEEPALDSGLSPSEVRHAIASGVANATRKAGGGAA